MDAFKQINNCLNQTNEKKPISYNTNAQVTEILNNFFNQIDYLTVIFNMELPYLLKIADDLPAQKEAIRVTLESLNERINRVIRNANIDKEEIDKIHQQLKLQLEQYNHFIDVEAFKLRVREAMKTNEWEAYKKFFCDHGVMREFVNEVTTENALQLCKYLVKSIDTVEGILKIINNLLDGLEENIGVVIKIRIKQIQSSWSLVTENVDQFKKQPIFWEGC